MSNRAWKILGIGTLGLAIFGAIFLIIFSHYAIVPAKVIIPPSNPIVATAAPSVRPGTIILVCEIQSNGVLEKCSRAS